MPEDIEMNDGHIDMPPLDHVETEPSPVDDGGLPPEIRQAQEMERQGISDQETPQQPVQAVEQPVVSAKEKEANLRIMRETAERAIRERDEMARRLQEYENSRPESRDEDFNIKEDELAEGRHITKMAKRIKELEENQRKHMRQNEEATADMRLRSQYPDIDKVVTLENVQMLVKAYPELAESLNSSQDPFKKAVSTYTAIKGFGIYTDQPNGNDKKKVAENAVKPKPLASVSPQQGESPLSRANAFSEGLTEERMAQYRKEMDYYASL